VIEGSLGIILISKSSNSIMTQARNSPQNLNFQDFSCNFIDFFGFFRTPSFVTEFGHNVDCGALKGASNEVPADKIHSVVDEIKAGKGDMVGYMRPTTYFQILGEKWHRQCSKSAESASSLTFSPDMFEKKRKSFTLGED
jgi:hypothetical protein